MTSHDHVTIRSFDLMSKSPSLLALALYHICCQEILWKARYNVSNLSRDIISPGDQRPLTCWMELHHRKWLLCHKYFVCISCQIIFLYFHVSSHDHMITWHYSVTLFYDKLNGYIAFWVGSLYLKSLLCQVSCL